MDNVEEIIELDGFITYYKYENEANGYRVASFKIDDNKQERTITIVGYFPHYTKDDSLKIKGVVTSHKKFGRQVEVSEIYKRLPTSKDNIIRFLSSSTFKHVGKKCATEIYDALEEDCISKLINDPTLYDILLARKIISEKQKESLQAGLREFDYTSSAFQMLLKHGFTLKNIMKAEAVYGPDLEKIILDNPYRMIIDIDGIGFKTVDKLALNIGIQTDDKRRLKAAIVYCVSFLCHSSGNTYCSIDEIYKYFLRFITIEKDVFMDYVEELIQDYLIVKDEDYYYHVDLYNSEINIAKQLIPFINRRMNTSIVDLHFDNLIKKIQFDEGIQYSNEQLEAIKGAVSNGLYIITGGPGTGKTTILHAILKMFKYIYSDDVKIALCAPTGRASKRMSMLTNNYACTIHRLLKWDLHSNSFAFNSNNRLHCDVIIIDEFSMVDSLLFEALLNGTCDVSQIIIIGDDNQIPSVGAGNLLYDLLKIDKINKMFLTYIYRQEEQSNIIKLAHEIRTNSLDERFVFDKDTRFLKTTNVRVANDIVYIINKLFECGNTFDDFQVILPMYANVAGIDNINATIQDAFNPYDGKSPQLHINHQVFRVHDRVLQLKNQPEDDIYNGDIGEIIYISDDLEEMIVRFDVGEVEYSKVYFQNLTLAYAISIHKSQGSEFNHVIMGIFQDYRNMLNKQLLYTGITRAKQTLTILGDYKTFLLKSKEENKNIRKTTLVKRINQFL